MSLPRQVNGLSAQIDRVDIYTNDADDKVDCLGKLEDSVNCHSEDLQGCQLSRISYVCPIFRWGFLLDEVRCPTG